MAEPEFDRWERRYASPAYHFGTAPNAFLKRKASLLKPGQKALAVADGEGRNSVFMAECGLDVTAFDFSPTALGKARALAKEHKVNVRFEQSDIYTWPWPAETFDVVVAIFIQFSPPPLRAKVFEGMKRTLKSGGLLLMEGYGPRQIEYKTGGPSNPDNLYSRGLLEQSFAGFASVAIEEYDAEVQEGSAHGGMSALIDFVGHK